MDLPIVIEIVDSDRRNSVNACHPKLVEGSPICNCDHANIPACSPTV